MHLSFVDGFYFLFSLIFVTGLAVVAAHSMQRFHKKHARSSNRLTSVETLALDRTRQIRIIACDGRECLLLLGAQDQSLLGWLNQPGTDGPERSSRT